MRPKSTAFKSRLLLVSCLALIGAGQTAALAAAGNGGGGIPSAGGQHGQDCAPGYNDTATGSCEHNGAGGGNCGDNQSGNDNGLGNNGNDNGLGHNGNGCAATTPPSNPPSIPTPPSTPNPPATGNPPTTPSSPHGDPGSGVTTQPSVACTASLRISRTRFIVGRRAILVVGVRTGDGTPLRGTTVLVRGAGIGLTAPTNTAGKARFIIRPRSAGVIRIELAQPSPCTSISRLARARDVFKPPKPNFTG